MVRDWCTWLVLLGLWSGTGCSKRDAPSAGASSASAAASSKPAAVARCRPAAGAGFSVGVGGAPPDAGTEDDDGADFLPFSIELGRAAPAEPGFAVSALRSESGGTHALVLLLSEQADRGQVVDLGRVFGDVDPPVLATRGKDVLVVVADSNPNGRRLQAVRVSAADGATVRGGELEPGRGFSGHDVEVESGHAMVVWDQLGPKTQRSQVWGARIDLASLVTSAPRLLSGEELSGESPRLVRRPGGYWLVFLEYPATASARDAGVKPASAESPDDPVLEWGPRGLAVLQLDAQGVPLRARATVTEPGAHVVSFDVAPTAGGGVVLAWRDDPSGPGTETGQVQGAMLGPDGSLSKQPPFGDDVGAGAPSLFAPDGTWLVIGGSGEGARLGRVEAGARRIEPPVAEPALRGVEVLAARGARLLLAQPRGLGVQFGVADCGVRSPVP